MIPASAQSHVWWRTARETGLYLPSSHPLTEKQIARIAETIREAQFALAKPNAVV
jgi:hypothetical protein